MDQNEKKAQELIAEAEKKMKGGFLSSIFGGSGKAEEAASLYEKAANSYKVAKNWQSAGHAFSQAARLSLEQKSKHDAATHLVSAATCYKKVDSNEAIHCLKRAIEIYTEMGRFTIAAKHHVSVAEIYEQDQTDVEKAIQHYETAADYYRGEESTSAANKCLLKVATLSAQMEYYDKAADLFDQIGKAAMENNLLRYGAKDHLFKSVVCQLCIDPINGNKTISSYEQMFPMFVDSREYKLLKKLLESLDEDNVESYTEAIREYDSISRLDPWMTSQLLKVKKNFSEEEDTR